MCCVWAHIRIRPPARIRRGGGTARGSWGPVEVDTLGGPTGPHLRRRAHGNMQRLMDELNYFLCLTSLVTAASLISDALIIIYCQTKPPFTAIPIYINLLIFS